MHGAKVFVRKYLVVCQGCPNYNSRDKCALEPVKVATHTSAGLKKSHICNMLLQL